MDDAACWTLSKRAGDGICLSQASQASHIDKEVAHIDNQKATEIFFRDGRPSIAKASEPAYSYLAMQFAIKATYYLARGERVS